MHHEPKETKTEKNLEKEQPPLFRFFGNILSNKVRKEQLLYLTTLLLFLITACSVGRSSLSTTNPNETLKRLVIVLGEDRTIFSSPTIPDTPIVINPNAVSSGGLELYMSNNDAERVKADINPDGTLGNLRLEGTALTKGESGFYDSCGNWIQGALSLNNFSIPIQNEILQNFGVTGVAPASVVIGFVHSETQCNYTELKTKKSIALAISTANGATFRKINYPNDQIITADSQFDSDPTKFNVGDFAIYVEGDYIYNFYLASEDWEIHVARAKISDLGKVNAWYKGTMSSEGQWSFTERGLGGKSTPVENLANGKILYFPKIGKYVAIETNQWGTFVSESESLLGPWTKDQLTPETLGDISTAWDRSSNSVELDAYASVINTGVNKNVLLNMFILPGEDYSHRYTSQRAIHFGTIKTDDLPEGVNSLIELASFGTLNNQIIYTTAIEGRDYREKAKYIETVGYLSGTQTAYTSEPIYEFQSGNKYFIGTKDAGADMTPARILGYATKDAYKGFNLPVFSNIPGHEKQIIGYAMSRELPAINYTDPMTK